MSLAFVGAFPILTAAPAVADVAPLPADPDSFLTVELQAIVGEPLSLETAVSLALANATDVREALAAAAAAEGAAQRERGTFDPELFAEITRSGSETPSSSPFSRPDVIEDELTESRAGLRLRLPIGTELEAALDAQRLDTNSEFASIDPEYRANARLELRQPLLRGLGAGTSAPRTAARRRARSAAEALRDARHLVRMQVETTYWELYAAERDLAVQRVIVDRAEALLDEARLRRDAGLVGPADVASARVFLADQKLSAMDREEALDAVSDRLAALIGARPGQAVRYRPTTTPPEREGLEPIEVLLERALDRNASIRAARLMLASAEADARGAALEALPSLDLVGTLGGTGLAGSTREVIFGGDTLRVGADGGYGEAIDQSLARDFPSWSVGLELSWPLMMNEGRGERARLGAEVNRAQARLAALEDSIETRLRAAHRAVVNSRERLEIAQEGVAAAFEQVRIGLIEYDNGRSTAFELVRLGADLASAQQRHSQALVRSARAAAELDYLTAGFPDPASQE